jgi:hypothetical protein
MGFAILYLKSFCEKTQKTKAVVRLSDCYSNIPVWGHSV